MESRCSDDLLGGGGTRGPLSVVAGGLAHGLSLRAALIRQGHCPCEINKRLLEE